MIKAVLFDIGNTLIDLDRAYEIQLENLVERDILQKHGFRVTREQFLEATREMSARKRDYSKKEEPLAYQKELMKILGIPWNKKAAQDMSDAFIHEKNQLLENESIMPHAVEILDYLHEKGFLLGIVTDASSSISKEWANQINRAHYFKTIIVSHEIGSKKSELKPFRRASEELQLEPSQCLMIGDTAGDMMAAKIGMKTCFFDRKNEALRLETKPDHVIHDLLELKKIIGEKESKKIPTSIVLVFNPSFSKILMLKRVKNQFGFDWGFVAGKSETDESPHETAVREMREEIGINQYPQHIFPLSEYNIQQKPSSFTHFVTSISQETPFTFSKKEIVQANWFPVTELPESRPKNEDEIIRSVQKFAQSKLSLPYRQNVQFWCFRDDGKILLLDESSPTEIYWKFPQGGIEKNETHEQAIRRELKEEINVQTFQIAAKAKYINRYFWPPSLQIKGYCGQEQTIYLVYLPKPQEVKPNHEEGINQCEWMTFREAIEKFLIPNQIEFAQKIWKEFEPIVKKMTSSKD